MWAIYPLLFLAGFVDSIAGGGGLISLSSYLAVGVPPHLALGTNKFSAFLGTGLSAAYFVKKGHVEWRSALYAFAGALVGAAAGAKIALFVDEKTLAAVLLTLLSAVAVFLIFKRDLGAVERPPAGWRYTMYAFLVGLGIGAYDGFFGPGTGMFMTIALTLLVRLELIKAVGTTKMLNFSSNIASLVTWFLNGKIILALAVPCTLCSIAGGFLGSRLAIKIGKKFIRPVLVLVAALLFVKILFDLIQSQAVIQP